MEKTLGHSVIPVVDVCGKRTLDYVIECLTKFSRKATQLTIRAIDGSISKATIVAQILVDKFSCRLMSTNVEFVELNQTKAFCLEIGLSFEPKSQQSEIADYQSSEEFIEFPIYHLLFDALLHNNGSLLISIPGGPPIVSVEEAKWNFRCKPAGQAAAKDLAKRITAAYYRSGLLLSPYWERVGRELSRYDDVILGVDTNILLQAVLSEQLLTSIFMIDPRGYVHTPNWVLVVIPNAVIHELEQLANSRNDKGFLREGGRIGFRALQEILELNNSVDLSGVSLMIVGEADPVLDTRVELRGLREDFAIRRQQDLAVARGKVGSKTEQAEAMQEEHDATAISRKTSSGDLIIRAQFRQFLRQIDFHKGIFFITADKSNAALARAEGLHSIYYRSPHYQEANRYQEPPSIQCNSSLGPIVLSVPIGRLIYELTVQFGNVRVDWKSGNVTIGCDSVGESLDHWMGKELRFTNEMLQKLLNLYARFGQFPLRQVGEICGEIREQLMGSEAL